MSNPLWGTRREVILSITLVAFASAAIAAAQWRTYGAAPAAEPLVIEEKSGIFGRGGDVHLGPAAAPLFTLEVGAPSDAVGTEIALPDAIFAGVGNSNSYGSASYSAGGAPGFTFGADVGNGSRPRRSSSGGGSGVGGGGFGFGGGGAWGGVSGSAARPTSTGTGTAVTARPSGTPKLARETFGSAGGASAGSPGVSAGFSSSAPGIEAGAPLGIKVSGLDSVPPAAGLQGDPAPRGPGSAPTPEPVTLLLVGLGAAALYGARRHFV